MGRQGNITLLGTSIPQTLIELIDYLIKLDYKQDGLSVTKPSRAKKMEQAILLLAYKQKILRKFLEEKGYQKEVVDHIMENQKEQYG